MDGGWKLCCTLYWLASLLLIKTAKFLSTSPHVSSLLVNGQADLSRVSEKTVYRDGFGKLMVDLDFSTKVSSVG